MAGIILGAELFVKEVADAERRRWAPAPLIVSLLITPIATELPEKFNSVLWMRPAQGHAGAGQHHRGDGLPEHLPGVGRAASSRPGGCRSTGLVSGVLALVSGVVFYLTLRLRHTLTWWSLGGAGSMYVVYLVYVLFLLTR